MLMLYELVNEVDLTLGFKRYAYYLISGDENSLAYN